MVPGFYHPSHPQIQGTKILPWLMNQDNSTQKTIAGVWKAGICVFFPEKTMADPGHWGVALVSIQATGFQILYTGRCHCTP